MGSEAKLDWPYAARTVTDAGDIMVRVRPTYLADYSNPEERRFVWAYDIEIENLGSETVQLQSRHWIITDAFGRVEEVRGPGVVGQRPVLKPGERYGYTSGCPLTTPSGGMVGSYHMTGEDGRMFEVSIPAFSLDTPEARGRLH
jgi:ApaG protein